jgi:hypothetical protein
MKALFLRSENEVLRYFIYLLPYLDIDPVVQWIEYPAASAGLNFRSKFL